MYCSSCGTESTPGLNYCNRCGAGLNTQAVATDTKASCGNLIPSTLILGTAVALITLMGFMILIKGADTLMRSELGRDPVMFMILMGMVTILIVDFMLIKQLSRLVNASLGAGSNRTRAKEIAAPRQTSRQLNSHPEPIASVTENTTRTFEPVYRESNR
jgi:hypothetical protein